MGQKQTICLICGVYFDYKYNSDVKRVCGNNGRYCNICEKYPERVCDNCHIYLCGVCKRPLDEWIENIINYPKSICDDCYNYCDKCPKRSYFDIVKTGCKDFYLPLYYNGMIFTCLYHTEAHMFIRTDKEYNKIFSMLLYFCKFNKIQYLPKHLCGIIFTDLNVDLRNTTDIIIDNADNEYLNKYIKKMK